MWQSLLISLLFPSYIVVSVRELANKQFSHFSANTFHSTMAQFPSSIEMNVNSNIILRGKSNLSSKANSRSFLISSSTSSISYHEHMEMKNNRPKIILESLLIAFNYPARIIQIKMSLLVEWLILLLQMGNNMYQIWHLP